MKEISLYIHIPFCKQKCFYCDFPSYAGKEELRGQYIEALIKELKAKASDYIIKTIFIGGGTPSYLEQDELKAILEAVSTLKLSREIEFSVECNPGTLSKEKLQLMKELGVNRLSFGLQSCDDGLLKAIGRIHSFNVFVENYNLAREVGFENINVDLMYGLPNQSVEQWRTTLKTICNLKPEHISAYSLIVEEGTAFYNMDQKGLLKLPTEDEEREMDKLTKNILKEHGYHQYEISNYSFKGKECKHNIVYWKLGEYIAIGTSCSSYINQERLVNIDDIALYIEKVKKGEEVVKERYKNDLNDEIEEFVFMGLRMTEGIDLLSFERKFNMNIESIYKKIIEKNINSGLLKIENNNMILTERGLDLSNFVMSEFILEK